MRFGAHGFEGAEHWDGDPILAHHDGKEQEKQEENKQQDGLPLCRDLGEKHREAATD